MCLRVRKGISRSWISAGLVRDATNERRPDLRAVCRKLLIKSPTQDLQATVNISGMEVLASAGIEVDDPGEDCELE